MKGEYKKSSSHTLNATSSFCNRSQAYFFCSSWSRGISEKPRKEIARNPCWKNLFPNCRSVILRERDTVNSTANLSAWMKTFDQSEHDTRSWTAASKARLQAPPPFPSPQDNAGYQSPLTEAWMWFTLPAPGQKRLNFSIWRRTVLWVAYQCLPPVYVRARLRGLALKWLSPK